MGKIEGCRRRLGKLERAAPRDLEARSDVAVSAANLARVEAHAARRPAEEEFARIVTGLVVNIDVARVIRRLAFSEPRISEPRAIRGDGQEITAARVVQAAGR